MSNREWALILLSMLRGIRSMAEIQADAGSQAWRKCVEKIDETLEEAKQDGLH